MIFPLYVLVRPDHFIRLALESLIMYLNGFSI
ncbi:hypothetical protein COMA1_70109 [Candidatus Nitrospira nitrosa]|uniref:Uncharacterized protein n=1 Tax=Candidatus Nitrospira nitrosa TaxID=1742972 RepID=A0A0S4LNT8_9BACT|nr:hypothetical protein COMA1_70109 [Candidatus Nitrospira nitrosa]